MTEKEILEGNTLIAEFEGLDFVPYKKNCSVGVKFKSYKQCQDYIAEHNLAGFIPELWWNTKSGKYDHDFASLMRAVEKIIQFKYDDEDSAYFRQLGMINAETGQYMARINRCQLFQADTLIEAVWLAVVDWCRQHGI